MSGTSASRTGRVRVLVVDDEDALTEVPSVATVTEAHGRPCPAADGQSALRTARGCAPHSVVLDGMPPDPEGIRVLRRLRHENPGFPVVTRVARSGRNGLHDGADDYVSTTPAEAVRGLLRRAGTDGTRADGSVRLPGEPELSEETREVHRAGRPIRLTAQERDLLGLLMDHPRQVLGKNRAPMTHSVREAGYTITAVEHGR